MPTIKVNQTFQVGEHTFREGIYVIGEGTLQDISEQYYECFEETEESQAQRTKLVELRDKSLNFKETITEASSDLSHSLKLIQHLTDRHEYVLNKISELEAEYNGWDVDKVKNYNGIRKITG